MVVLAFRGVAAIRAPVHQDGPEPIVLHVCEINSHLRFDFVIL
jgi:hypothetical protein